MQILPTKYLVPALFVATLVILLLLIAHFKKTLSVVKSIALILMSLVMIGGNIYVYMASSATTSFLSTVQEDDYTYEQYSIIAKKDRHISLTSSDKHHMGLLQTDTNKELVTAAVAEKTSATYKEHSDITSLTVALDTNETDTATLKSSYVQLIKDNYDAFYQRSETLTTFTIKIKKSVSTVKTDPAKPFIIYISGIDTYGNVASVSRSDVNMLAVVNPVTRKILLVNTPRDYYVQLHGTTGSKDKLTHAGIYGIDMSVQTLEDLYATPIDYYLRVNFSSLTKIVTVLGGVDVYSDYTFTSGKDSFKQGPNTLNAAQALAFSRTRYAFANGDRTRGENQQRVIEAIIAKVNNPGTLVNYRQMLASLEGTFQTNMSADNMTALIKSQLNDIGTWKTESISVTGADSRNYTYSMGSIPLYVMEPDAASMDNAKQKIQQYLQ